MVVVIFGAVSESSREGEFAVLLVVCVVVAYEMEFVGDDIVKREERAR